MAKLQPINMSDLNITGGLYTEVSPLLQAVRAFVSHFFRPVAR